MASNQPSQQDIQGLMLLMQASKFAEAEKRCRKYIKKFPKVLGFYDVMSKAQISQENFTGVVKTLEAALKINPDFVDGEYNLGVAYMNINKLEKALNCFKNITSKRPDFFEAYNNMGGCYIELQRFDEGIDAYQKAVSIKPDFVPSLRNLGAALRDMGRVEEAEVILERIPPLKPDFALGHLSLGVAKSELGKLEEAINCFKNAIKLQPEMHVAHYELGKAYKEVGKLEEALSSLEKVDNMIARVQVLETLHELERKEELLERLPVLNAEEPTNLRAAAFSAFACHQYGIENNHDFCPNPISFVSVQKIEDEADGSSLLENLMSAADELTTVWQHATTKGGTQTHGNLFDPQLENEYFSQLEKIIRKQIRTYVDSFKDSDVGLIQSFPKQFSLSGWRVKLMKGGHQKAHIHSGGWLSGVFYLQVPKKMKANEGAIAFSLHGYDYRVENQDIPTKEHTPLAGELVLFPSSLFHWTIPFDSDEERQCIAFDVIPG